ncbi:protein MEI2-like 6 [Rosa rugosa]|uniref:protein MEI2-like 6 n=1 Tax=Rosa rugosa TaxID=74645 RepID=UPI002B40E68E|nr:protein MEI2-like 6 [Rosa rugosa]
MGSKPLNSNAQPFFASRFHNFQTYVCYNYPIYADHHLHPNLFHHQLNPTAVVEFPRVPMRRLRKRNGRKRNIGALSRGATGEGGVIPFPSGPDQQQNGSSATTTIMIKNIPNQFRRSDLLGILMEHCLVENLDAVVRSDPNKSEFDFVYLPMDFNKNRGSNLGYAFVNFTGAIGAQRFYQRYHNFEWDVEQNKKTCAITCAKIQGKKALIGNFRHKVFRCEFDEYLPVVVAPPCDGVSPPKLTLLGKLRGAPKYPTRAPVD